MRLSPTVFSRTLASAKARVRWGGASSSAGSLEACALAMRVLAGLLRAGVPPRHALVLWHEHAPSGLRPGLAGVARRLQLGEATGRAVATLESEIGEDARALANVFSLSSRLGGDVAVMLEGVAQAIDQRRASLGAARSSGAAAHLSARLVAGLPLAFLPLAPMSRAPLFDGPGLFLLFVGLALALAGMRWMTKLIPKPDVFDDGPAAVADLVACVLDGGASLTAALDTIGEQPPEQVAGTMPRARRMVRLGASWPEALKRLESPGLAALGLSLEHAGVLGLPMARSLRSFAATRRAERAREFEESTRRAPVLMVIPLTVCVLPSFVLLALGPFLRGLSLGA